jgi:hypothetical protein
MAKIEVILRYLLEWKWFCFLLLILSCLLSFALPFLVLGLSTGAILRDLLKRNWFCILLIFLCCFLSFALPLLILGLPSGYDMLFDIRMASAFRDALLAGHFFPGWANDNFGFGSIAVRFYPPLAFYILAFAEMISGNWFSAILGNLFFWMFVGSVGVYFFVKEWGTPEQGLMAGLIYSVIPQHLNEIFQFFLFAEFAAWGVIPFCFLFVTRLCRNGKWSDVVYFALSYSLLILTHIPTTIIVSFCLPVYVLVVMDWRRYKPVFLRLGCAIVLTLGATAFRWVTIVSESKWLLHNSSKYSTGYFDFSAWLFPNVLASRNLFVYVLSSWLFDISILLTLFLIIPGTIILLKQKKGARDTVTRILLASSVTALFALFMLSRPSEVIWRNIEFLQKIQFPWRWLSVMSLLLVVGFALAVPQLLKLYKKKERLIAYPVIALISGIILFNITQIIIPSAPIPAAQFAKVEADLATQPMFEAWWPSWAKEGAFENQERVTAENRFVEVTSWESEAKTFTVQQGEPVNLRVATFYYPYWKATINDQEAKVAMDENGAILIPVSTAASKIHLYFEEPFIYKIALWLSLSTWVLLLSAIFACKRKELFSERFGFDFLRPRSEPVT